MEKIILNCPSDFVEFMMTYVDESELYTAKSEKKLDIIHKIMEREGIEVDINGWEKDYDEILNGSWNGE